MTDTQTRRIFERLWHQGPPGWVPAYVFPNDLHILQYNARIFDLRRKGLTIESQNINGVDCFRLLGDKDTISYETMRPIPRTAAVGETMNLFGERDRT
jgi:hypothetical protein